jgi:hypothetical protein
VHQTVNHSENFKDPVTGAHTNNIECTWHCLKKSKRKSGFAKTLIAGYFAEFIFRRKYLGDKSNPFFEFLINGVKKLYTIEKAEGLSSPNNKRPSRRKEEEKTQKKEQQNDHRLTTLYQS